MITYKSWQGYANFTDDSAVFTIPRFFTVKPELAIRLGHDKLLTIGLFLRTEVFVDQEHNELAVQNSQLALTRSQSRRRNKASQNRYNGLVNEGTTCYLNSLMQTLFIIRAFRRAVYQMPTNIDDFKSIPFCI